MFRSIQSSLQIWHAILLLIILFVFDVAVYSSVSTTRIGQVNSELSLSAQTLAAGIKPPPPPNHDPQGGPDDHDLEDRDTTLDRISPDSKDPHRWPPPRKPSGPRSDLGDKGRRDDNGRPPHNRMKRMGVPSVQLPKEWTIDSRDSQSRYFRIWHHTDLIARSDDNLEIAAPEILQRRRGWLEPKPPTIRERGSLREAYVCGDFDTIILVGQSIAFEQTQLSRLAAILVTISGVIWLGGLMVGWLISLRTMRPIRTMTNVAQRISGSNLSARIDTASAKAELRALADVLNETFARLEAAFHQQSRFIADASHELRTPLSVIHTHAQLALTRDRTVQEYRKTLETCLHASSRMTDLVNALLLIARADGGSVALNINRVNLQDIVIDAVELVSPLAKARNITIDSNLQPLVVEVDIACMNQLVTNLLTNAIRYNRHEGSIHVNLKSDGHEFVLSISDTGVGIPEESLPHVFERFYRADEARNRTDGGAGLGLAICKSIVDAHQGIINVTSSMSIGTTFEIRIPLRSATIPHKRSNSAD